MPRDEWQQQLPADLEDRIDRRLRVLPARPHQQMREERGDEDTEQIGQRRRSDRCGYVAAGDRGEGDRGLDGGGQQRQIEQPRRHRRRGLARHRLRAEPEQRIEQEAGRQHRQMQPPFGRPRDDRGAAQLGAVQEEQQQDRDIRQPAEQRRPPAARGQDRCRQHRRDQRCEEGIEQVLGAVQHRRAIARSRAHGNCVPAPEKPGPP